MHCRPHHHAPVRYCLAVPWQNAPPDVTLDDPYAYNSLTVAARAEPRHLAADHLRAVLVTEFGDDSCA
ncbi:hypothetical protein [Ornithinimicrobium sediminis]|uniref:hypothetical protein n=1 Tax=Ornithinimicrobium sediminis TaxID=2904603 RepID=UPI001E4F9BDE|nr:hypothetical protein [Ornithinimicrobium sediminis]MCE0488437.1 hypothetical protein [Ornithinimicrobium sediminis]